MNSSKEEFAHLHIHNEYSLLDGYGTAQQYVERAKQLGMEHLALTNHMNVDGCVRWQQACDEAGIHSILGCEMYLVEDIKYRPPRDKTQRRERTYHITLPRWMEEYSPSSHPSKSPRILLPTPHRPLFALGELFWPHHYVCLCLFLYPNRMGQGLTRGLSGQVFACLSGSYAAQLQRPSRGKRSCFEPC